MDGHFTGYASLFGVPDLGNDVVSAGAFAVSLGERGAAGVRMLFQHDPAEPIGRWLSLREDARGLRVEGLINLAVQRGREVDALMRGGGLDGLSIGFRTLRRARSAAACAACSQSTSGRFPSSPSHSCPAPAPLCPDGTVTPLARELRAFAHRLAPRGAPSPRTASAPSPFTQQTRFA